MLYEGDDWYADVLLPLAELYVREAVYASPKLDLPADILIAAVIDVWERLRGDVVGIDTLEIARDIALQIPQAELTEEPAIPDQHVHDVVEGPAKPDPKADLFGVPRSNNPGLFK